MNIKIDRVTVTNLRYLKEDCWCKQLWKNVLIQQIMDATQKGKKPEHIQIRRDATDWLLKDDKDFKEVCEKAGFDPKTTREAVKDMIEEYLYSTTIH